MVRLVGCFRVPKRRVKVVPAPTGEGVFTIGMSSTSTLDVSSTEPVSTDAGAMQARHSIWWHLLIDLPILLLVAAVSILLEIGAIPSRQSGFTCHDPALSFPHSGDTFPLSFLFLMSAVLPFFVIWIVEAILHSEDEYNPKKNKVLASVKTTSIIFRNYVYVEVLNFTILEVLKCMVGTPRPTFFALCQPDREKTCNGSEYIASYECTSSEYSRYLTLDSSRSFPSGHASMSLYSGLFVAWYLQRRAFSWHNRSVLLVPLVQLMFITSAAVVCVSRITDHRHHWWDVLFGATLGVICALYSVLVMCKNFTQHTVVSTSDLSSSDGNNHQSVRRLLASGGHVVVP